MTGDWFGMAMTFLLFMHVHMLGNNVFACMLDFCKRDRNETQGDGLGELSYWIGLEKESKALVHQKMKFVAARIAFHAS